MEGGARGGAGASSWVLGCGVGRSYRGGRCGRNRCPVWLARRIFGGGAELGAHDLDDGAARSVAVPADGPAGAGTAGTLAAQCIHGYHRAAGHAGDGSARATWGQGPQRRWTLLRGLPGRQFERLGVFKPGLQGVEGRSVCLARKALLAKLRMRFSELEVDDAYAENSDALDGLVAALTARAAALGATIGAAPEETALARREGWIHVPRV
jgi:hypothetical protein